MQSMDGRKMKRATDPDSMSIVPVDTSIPILVESTPDLPKRRRRLTSAVWNDFVKIKKDGADVAICRYCEKELSGSSSSGTTHLNNHLKRCPSKSNTYFDHRMNGTTEKKREANSSLRGFKYDEKRSRLELARMIIYHEYPFSIVEHVGFRRFVYSLCPSFNVISRNTIRDDCVALYENEKKRIHDVLDKLSCRVSLTLNFWTSCQETEDTEILCLMVHYLDDCWQLKKRIINFMNVEDRRNGELFANFLLKQITDWNIHQKLFSLTLDNVDAAANTEVKNRLCQSKLLLSNGQFFQIQCAASIINSVVRSISERSKVVIINIREIIEFVSSTQHQHIFDAVVQELQLNVQKGLYLDVPPQWNTTYSMIQIFLEYKDAFVQFHSRVPEFTCMLSEEQWAEATSVCNCLKIFYDVTYLLSSTNHPTANLFFEEFCEIQLQLVEWLNSSDELTKSTASMMKEEFDKYWDKCSTTLAVASILDPRYKMKLVECYYPQIYGSNAEHHIKLVVDAFRNLYEEYASRSRSSLSDGFHGEEGENQENNGISHDIGGENKEKLRRFDRFLQENTHSQHLKSDMDEFLDEGVFPRDRDKPFNVWDWWKANVPKYPLLSKMARDVLAISVSTVTPEYVFSTGSASRVLDTYRSSLDSETVQALMCMQDWLKDEMGGAVSSVIGSVCPSVMDMTPCSPEQLSFDFS